MPDPTDVPEAPEVPEGVDPWVADMVLAVRDRFGLRGLRGAQALIDKEIVLAEDALAELTADQPG